MPTAKPSACAGCPAFTSGKGFVPAEGDPLSRMMLIGQGPGQDEYLDSRPFVGPAGRKLDYWLARAGLDRSKLAVGNAVWCWLPANREPTRPEFEFCRAAHWQRWLESFPDVRVVVPIGMSATVAILGKGTRSGAVGMVHPLPPVDQGPQLPVVVLPIQHPAFILRGNWAEEPAQIEYLKYAKDIANGQANPLGEVRSFSEPPAGLAGYYPTPTLTDLGKWRDQLTDESITVDIETAGEHIRLVGFYGSAAGYLSFPIRVAGGGLYWSDSDFPSAVGWLWDLLSDSSVSKCFHNGQAFDVPMLERSGFVVAGYTFDTMLGMHVAYPGVPKGLEDLAKVYLRCGGWKQLVKIEGEGEAK